MKLRVHSAAGIAISLIVAGTALAGSHGPIPVELYTDAAGLRAARGTLRDARFSADNVQYIGCSVSVYEAGDVVGHCTAKNAAGLARSCSTTAPGMLKNINAVNAASFIYFSVNADGQTCDRVIAVNGSENL
jgi:hypothetical protein